MMKRIEIPIYFFLNLVCGVYLLKHKKEIVYIGKSINILNRIKKHIDEKQKIFDKIEVILCEKDEIDLLEIELIKKYKPKYNIVFNTDKTKELVKKRQQSGKITRELNKRLKKEIQKHEKEINRNYNIENAKKYLLEIKKTNEPPDKNKHT